jgi:hypothetical protein
MGGAGGLFVVDGRQTGDVLLHQLVGPAAPSGPEHADQPLFDPAGDELLGDAVFAGGLGLGDPGWRFGGPS